MRTITLAIVLTVAALAQWLNLPTPGIPRTADGKPNLTAPVPRMPDGKPDLSGLWRPAVSPYRFDVIQDLKDESFIRPASSRCCTSSADSGRSTPTAANCRKIRTPPGWATLSGIGKATR